SGHLWLLGHRFSRQSWIRQLPDPLPQGAQWLLAQQQVLVQNARVLWRDDSQQGVSSRLDAITIQLQNTARRHRLGLLANVAGSKAGKIEGSGYIKRQTPFGPPGRGAIQLTLPELPAKQWRSWIELPSELLFSTASMKAWLTLEHGRLNHLTTRLAAQEVSLTLVEDTVVTTQQAYADIQLQFAHLRPPMRGFKTAAEHGVQATVSAQKMQVLAPQAYDHAL